MVLTVSFSGDVYEARGAKRVDGEWELSDCDCLRNTTTGPTGIYRCDIPTNSVHDNTDNSVRDTVYVGLYTTGEGSYKTHTNVSLKTSFL